MIKRSDPNPQELSPGLTKLAAPEYAAAFGHWRELTARFDLFNNSELGRSLKWIESLNSSLIQSLKLNSMLTETFAQMERLRLPSIQALNCIQKLRSPVSQALNLTNSPLTQTFKQLDGLNLPSAQLLKQMDRLTSPLTQMLARFDSPFKQIRLDNPAFAAIQAAKLWSDSLSESHRSAQLSMQETLQVFQRAAEEAAAMARVDVSALATAVDTSLGPLPLPDAAQLPVSTSAPDPSSLKDAWKALPFSVQLFLFLLWNLLLIPLAASYVQQWIKASPASRSEIIVNVNQNLGKNFSHDLRCVRGAGVNIRESPSKTAPIIGRLSRSQSVAILETEHGFSKIQYEDASTREIREGWVASGYLVGSAC